jgi:hypothetical protein
MTSLSDINTGKRLEGPRVNVEIVEKTKKFCHFLTLKHDSSVLRLVA